jgi:hypothetical protein
MPLSPDISAYPSLSTEELIAELAGRTALLAHAEIDHAERVCHLHRVFWEAYQASENETAVGRMRDAQRRSLPILASDDGILTHKAFMNETARRIDLLRMLIGIRTGVVMESSRMLHLESVPS